MLVCLSRTSNSLGCASKGGPPQLLYAATGYNRAVTAHKSGGAINLIISYFTVIILFHVKAPKPLKSTDQFKLT